MSYTTRFLTGSLASLAVASGVSLAAPAAYADAPARPCGQPAVAAIFATMVQEPELRQVAAVTHDEWRWERQVTTYLREYSTVLTPAYTVTTWTRNLPTFTEYRWSHEVITQEAQVAIPATPEIGHWEGVVGQPTGTRVEFEYIQQQTGNTRWEADGWNGDNGDVDHGKGWTRTDHAQQWVVTQPASSGSDAVPEISGLEYTWSATSPGAGWSKTAEPPHTTGGGTETTTTTGDDEPAGGWTKTGSDTAPAKVKTVWAYEAPEGYTATNTAPKEEHSTESTSGTSATAPGEGWSKVVDSLVVKVDQEATTQLVGGGTEQVLVRPGLPATDACAPAKSSDIAGPQASGPQAGSTKASGSAAVSTTAAAAAHTGTVLPATGSPISPLLLTTGLGALLTGGALLQVGRRRRTS
jgi:hypothetical protein